MNDIGMRRQTATRSGTKVTKNTKITKSFVVFGVFVIFVAERPPWPVKAP